MTSKIIDISSYSFQAEDHLFFDANIWLYIASPFYKPTDPRTRIYSRALRDILAVNAKIYTDVLILSEYVNTYARLAHNHSPLKSSTPHFKDFRKSQAFEPIAQEISLGMRRLLKTCLPVESGFSSLNQEVLCKEFESGKVDFNDQVIAKLCTEQGLTLVSHDGDFDSAGINLLTKNRTLLNKGV
jgi:predicted nucleic acid-binding protein